MSVPLTPVCDVHLSVIQHLLCIHSFNCPFGQVISQVGRRMWVKGRHTSIAAWESPVATI